MGRAYDMYRRWACRHCHDDKRALPHHAAEMCLVSSHIPSRIPLIPLIPTSLLRTHQTPSIFPMSSPVRASTRISIAWSGAGAYEDTDTLVLTINGWSLDLRVYSGGPHKGGVEWATVGNVVELEGSTDGASCVVLRGFFLYGASSQCDRTESGACGVVRVLSLSVSFPR